MHTLFLVTDEFSKKCDNYNSISLNTIINAVEVETFPYVITIQTIFIIRGVDKKKPFDLQVGVYNVDDEIIAQSNKVILKNEMSHAKIPLVQNGLKIKFAVSQESPVLLKLFINNVEKANYPVQIVLKDGA